MIGPEFTPVSTTELQATYPCGNTGKPVSVLWHGERHCISKLDEYWELHFKKCENCREIAIAEPLETIPTRMEGVGIEMKKDPHGHNR